MTTQFKPGPARCRSDEYEARIYATDAGGKYPIHGAWKIKSQPYWVQETWTIDGLSYPDEGEQYRDLLPQCLEMPSESTDALMQLPLMGGVRLTKITFEYEKDERIEHDEGEGQ